MWLYVGTQCEHFRCGEQFLCRRGLSSSYTNARCKCKLSLSVVHRRFNNLVTPLKVPQASLNVRNFPAGSGKDANGKIFNYLFSSSVDPQDNYKSLSSASTPVYATAHGAAVPSAGGLNGNLNAMSFIVPGNKSFFPGGLTGGAHYQLQRGNTNDDDFDAFALSNPNDIVL